MNLDRRVWRVEWAGSPVEMGGVGSLAQRAEAIGVRTLSFMDHYFHMQVRAPADDPILEGSHRLEEGVADLLADVERRR